MRINSAVLWLVASVLSLPMLAFGKDTMDKPTKEAREKPTKEAADKPSKEAREKPAKEARPKETPAHKEASVDKAQRDAAAMDRAREKHNREMLEKSRQNPNSYKETRAYQGASPEKRQTIDREAARDRILYDRVKSGQISKEEWARQHQMPLDEWDRKHK